MRRDTFTPVFSIEITGVQLDVLIKIKEFLEKSLGFNLYSLYKLKNSSIIAVTTVKPRKNSKSSVSLIIKNVRVLNNYLVPFLEDMIFLTKKGKDFQDGAAGDLKVGSKIQATIDRNTKEVYSVWYDY